MRILILVFQHKVTKMGHFLIYLKTNSKPFFLYLTLLILIFYFKLNAQGHDLRFRHITKENGLSQNIINCIIQDKKGFMWFGTGEGLDKYDGYKFINYVKGKDNGNFLSSDNIYSIFEDNKNNLWIGTQNGGINIYNKVLNKFTRLSLDSLPESVQNKNKIRSILRDNRGNIWFIAGNAIINVNSFDNHFNTFVPQKIKSELNVLFQDSFNNMWFGSDGDGLGLFNTKNKTFRFFTHNRLDKNSISDNFVLSIYEDPEKNLWIGTYNGGLNLCDTQKKVFTAYLPKPNNRESHTIRSILDDKEGNLWLGTRDGLYIFNKNTHHFKHFYHDPFNPYSLTQNNVQMVYKDNRGNFWLGTKRGINFLNKKNMQFTHYGVNPQNNRYLNGSIILSITEDHDHNIWFGTEDGGLNLLYRKTGIFKHYTHDPNDPCSISNNNVTAIAEDKSGNLWIGTYQGGLNFFDSKRNCFSHFIYNPEISFNNSNSINTNSLLIGQNHILWICTGNGLITFNMKKRIFEKNLFSNGSQYKMINCITQGEKNYIWAGGKNSRIYHLNQLTSEYESYKIPINDQYAWITALLFDGKDLWIGTKGYGFINFIKKQNKFYIYTTNNGLSNDNILGLLQDDKGNIWISTLDGLSKFNPNKKKFTNFSKDDGLQNNEFSHGILKTHTGEFFLGDIDGAISFNPNEITENSSPLPIVFTDFKIFNKPVPIGGDNPILKSQISLAKEIDLSYNQSSFTISFAALALDMKDNINYAYIMEGFETDWNYVGNRRYATYTNLDPGTYTFKVNASIHGNEWTSKNAFINISISPPYWYTWWFKTLIFSSIGLMIWFFTNYVLQKRNLLKTTALANLTQLKLLRNQMNPHFLLNAFSSIRALILIDKETAWEMISKFSDFFRYTLLNYNSEKDTLNDEIEAAQNYISVQKVCFHENLKVSFEVDEGVRKLTVPTFILQPLIENAIKFGIKTNEKLYKIKVKIVFKKGILSINVSNMGVLKNMNKEYYAEDNKNGTSINNIKKRLSIMFKENASFQLFEEDGWVHASIKIYYNNNKREHNSLTHNNKEKIKA